MATCVLHSTLIQKFCRVCGNTMKGRVTYIAEKYTEALKNRFTFDIENNDIYPRSFCNTCYTTVLNKRKNNFESKNPAFIWSAHNPVICTHMLTKSKGGRPKKRQNKGGRPPTISKVITTEDILKLSPSKPVPKEIEKCISHVISVKMKQSSLPNNTVQLATKGPPVTNNYHSCT